MMAGMLFVALAVTAGAADVSPLGKVMEMLTELQAKVTSEGEAEAAAYKEYFEWCDDAVTEKSFEIKTATSSKEGLEAEVAKQDSIAQGASPRIEALAASIAEDEAELKSATGVREKETADFVADEMELLDVTDTLSRAIHIVEKQMAKNPSSFAQIDGSNFGNLVKTLGAIVDAASFPSASKNKLLALVQSQQTGEDEDIGAPAAAVYTTQSTGIVDVLEDLKEKAEEQLGSLRKAEATAQHNFDMLKQSLEDSIGADSKALAAEKTKKAAAEEAKAAAEGDLAVAVKVLAEGESAKETIQNSCMHEAADHETAVNARTAELKVISEAKGILAESTSGAASQTYSFLQVASQEHQVRNKVVVMVKRLAKQQKSAALGQLASRISALFQYGAAAGEDPFTKVKELITGLIAKLEDEEASAANEKAYCDEQMSKTEEKKTEISEDVDKLTTKIDQASAKSTSLKEEVKTLEAELAALAKSQSSLDAVRAESHAVYTTAKAELEEGLTGVRNAIGVLRDYYGSASSASMLQDFDADSQPTPPEAHVKKTGAGQSIISILEVVESDFAKNLAVVETEESDEVSEYERLTEENKLTKTVKDQGVKYKTQEYKALDKSLTELKADLESKEAELNAVLEYYEKIKERCIAKAETYEARVEKRAAEIAGLKEALSVLENEAAFVQRRKGRRGQSFLGVE